MELVGRGKGIDIQAHVHDVEFVENSLERLFLPLIAHWRLDLVDRFEAKSGDV